MASMAIPADPAAMGGAGAQSPVLRVIVENLFYPVTLDVLHQVQNVFAICLSHSTAYYRLVSPFLILKQTLGSLCYFQCFALAH